MNAMDAVLRLGEKVDKEGFIAVVPNGLPDRFRGWNAGFFKLAGTPSDTDFISSILDKVEKEFNIDKKREFIMGHSNGAMMSMFLGSKLAPRIAAVAGISGTIGIPGTDPSMRIPNLPTAISAMFIHGMKDTVVAYKKSDKAMLVPIGAQESAAWWAEQTKATPTPPKDESSFTRQTYTNGTLGCEVELISCKFGTHEVPGGYYATGQEKASGIIAMDEIWRFFSSHPKA
jgi:polyhydroxybutyrate depolymerase